MYAARRVVLTTKEENMYKIAKMTFEAADGAQKDRQQLQEQVENYFSALINQ